MSVRCRYCHDLFITEHGLLPTHYLDIPGVALECDGSGSPEYTLKEAA